jgi:hypothetical protein
MKGLQRSRTDQVHRLDLAFADGSWLALRLRRPGAVRDAARLLSG